MDDEQQIRHVTFSCRGCRRDVCVASVSCDACSTRRGVTREEWEIVRDVVVAAATGRDVDYATFKRALDLVDRALREPEPR